jgi:hypothetical protein
LNEERHMPNLSHDIDDEQVACIHVNGESLSVTPDSIPVSVRNKHRVHWFLAGDGTIEAIAFDGGRHPFLAEHIVPKSKKHVLSHPVSDAKHIGKKFKYTVFVTLAGGKKVSLDPEVNVTP